MRREAPVWLVILVATLPTIACIFASAYLVAKGFGWQAGVFLGLSVLMLPRWR